MTVKLAWYRDSVDNTVEENFGIFLPNLNALVAVSNSTRAVKLCTNKILQFLTGGVSKRRLTWKVVVKQWLLLID